MTFALAGVLVVTVLAFVWLLDRKDQRARAERDVLRDACAGESEVLRLALVESFAAHRAEVAELCQRLQAPERAVIQHEQESSPAGEVVAPMTDQEYEEQQEQLRAALLEIERVENEGVLP